MRVREKSLSDFKERYFALTETLSQVDFLSFKNFSFYIPELRPVWEYCNNFFNLKKHINFDNAKQAGSSLQKELALKQATNCYEKYIADNNP